MNTSDLRRLLLFTLLGGLVTLLMMLLHLDLPEAGLPALDQDNRMLTEQARQERLRAEGRALWQGDWAMQASLPGRVHGLDGQSSRCVRCHGGSTLPRALLDRSGGSQAGLCRLLREGRRADGSAVTAAMPRYDAADSDCAALWSHLVPGSALKH
ncbi:hypothetical protein [Sphaerotilus uruguayifluvii]|uniref:Cytochrome c domain-containing protein n=1 Tax=Sphaerotilus uruguayifluvii TaxID=2735897 RepID=A0ABX2FYW9_9BURK|nr:hypothetical protein [Leptothrix sp. C29]NRT55204.1 hypothetical protein [Leptothrix sp. C29]